MFCSGMPCTSPGGLWGDPKTACAGHGVIPDQPWGVSLGESQAPGLGMGRDRDLGASGTSWGTTELPGHPDPSCPHWWTGLKEARVTQAGVPWAPGLAVPLPPLLPALFCLSRAAQSALVPSGSEVGQGGWAEPPGPPRGGELTGGAQGPRHPPQQLLHRVGAHLCPGETPVPPTQGMPGISPDPPQSPGAVWGLPAPPQALPRSGEPESLGRGLGWSSCGVPRGCGGERAWGWVGAGRR